MTTPPPPLAFDTGPLLHFTKQGWLGVLKLLAKDREVLIPVSVENEILDKRHEHPELSLVLDADWITVARNEDLEYLAAFATFKARLAVGRKNLGECGVLALGETQGCEVVIDDGTARNIAAERGLAFTATLNLLCEAIRERTLTVPMVEQVADDLLSGDYYLPFGPGGFRRWALEEGGLDYDEL
ncbi:MAG: nucleotide-binding protein [Brachybacterium sp.]|uniref:nucleotide-binding protein n=1 Tax=Brachybacterium sp. AOP42-E1-35 TaxID=3457664 RepID=UPI003FB859A5